MGRWEAALGRFVRGSRPEPGLGPEGDRPVGELETEKLVVYWEESSRSEAPRDCDVAGEDRIFGVTAAGEPPAACLTPAPP